MQLIVRVTPEEHEFILEKMEALSTRNFNAFARKMLIDGHGIIVDLKDYHKLANEVNKIGVNINQIAKTANKIDYVYYTDIAHLKEMMDKIWQLLKSSLSTLLSISQ